jgi:hypothetical protein
LCVTEETKRDLDAALPALDEAVQSLQYLKKSDLDVLRTMARPPSGVRLTMEAACIMCGLKPQVSSAAQRAKLVALGVEGVCPKSVPVTLTL